MWSRVWRDLFNCICKLARPTSSATIIVFHRVGVFRITSFQIRNTPESFCIHSPGLSRSGIKYLNTNESSPGGRWSMAGGLFLRSTSISVLHAFIVMRICRSLLTAVISYCSSRSSSDHAWCSSSIFSLPIIQVSSNNPCYEPAWKRLTKLVYFILTAEYLCYPNQA